MNNKIKTIILTLFMCLMMAVPALAGDKKYVVDNAEVISDSDEEKLEDKLEKLSKDRDMDIVVLTVKDLDGKIAENYADDFFDNEDYGQGSKKSGMLLLVATESRDWAISTKGKAIDVFTDGKQQKLMENVKPKLSSEDYTQAFNEYEKSASKIIANAYDFQPVKKFLISLAIGFIITLIVALSMKSSLTSVRSEPEAKEYIKKNSFNVTRRNDLFIYKTVTKTEIPKDSSSTHTSSSGSTHGGSSGKF